MHNLSDNGRWVNMEAPERIWAAKSDEIVGQVHIGPWADQEPYFGGTAFVRADLIPAMLAAEREKALREALDVLQGVSRDEMEDEFGILPPDRFDEGTSASYEAILDLIPKGGDAL